MTTDPLARAARRLRIELVETPAAEMPQSGNDATAVVALDGRPRAVAVCTARLDRDTDFVIAHELAHALDRRGFARESTGRFARAQVRAGRAVGLPDTDALEWADNLPTRALRRLAAHAVYAEMTRLAHRAERC